MKTRFQCVTSLFLALVMTLSVMSISVSAQDAFPYAYLELGAARGSPGDTVKVSVYLRGLKEGQKCSGVIASIKLGDNLTLAGAERTELTDGFDKDCSPDGYLAIADMMGFGTRIEQNGKLCDLLVKIDEKAVSVGAVTVTKIQIIGNNSSTLLNSGDGTQQSADQEAVIYPTDGNGKAIPVISLDTPAAAFSINVEADKTRVTAGEDVSVTVKAEGGDFEFAAARLRYESDKFTLKTAPEGWNATDGGSYAYYHAAAGGEPLPAVLGVFVFTAEVQREETVGCFTLSDTYCSGTLEEDDPFGKSDVPCASTGKAEVTIALRDDLNVTAADAEAVYDGQPHAFTPVASTAAGAVIRYGETRGTYDLTEVPAKTEADEYTLYYQVTAPGYAAKTGSIQLTIRPADIVFDITANESATYDGGAHPSAAVSRLLPADAEVTYTCGGQTYREIPTFTEVGEYTVDYTVRAGTNYTPLSGSYTFRIKAGRIEAAASGYSGVYDGGSHGITVTVTSPEDAAVSYRTGEGEAWSSENPAFTDVGTYTVYYRVGRTGYTDVTGSAAVAITPAALTGVTVTPAAESTFDNQLHASAAVSGVPEGVPMTFRWMENGTERTSATVPQFTDAGKYEISYVIGGGNYEEASGSYSFEIGRYVVAPQAGGDVRAVYDGQPRSIGFTVSQADADFAKRCGVTLKLMYTAEVNGTANTETEEPPSLTDAGSMTVECRPVPEGSGAGNFTGGLAGGTVTITPRDAVITVDAMEKTLGAADPVFTGSVEGLVKEGDLGIVTYGRADRGEAAGTYEISASYTENPNYTVTVKPALLTIKAPAYAAETSEYVNGYSLVLVYTNDSASFTYDGRAMYDVTSAGYRFHNETACNHVYGLVVKGAADTGRIAAGTALAAGTLKCDDLDVNQSGTGDTEDAKLVAAVYNVRSHYLDNPKFMSIVLEADLNHDKMVDMDDFALLKAEYLKK